MSPAELSLDSVAAELDAITLSAASLNNNTDEAELALGRLFRAVQKFNYLTRAQLSPNLKPFDSGTQVPPSDSTGILQDFDTWVQKFKEALAQIAKVFGAAQYSIGVQFPFALSVSVTFAP